MDWDPKKAADAAPASATGAVDAPRGAPIDRRAVVKTAALLTTGLLAGPRWSPSPAKAALPPERQFAQAGDHIRLIKGAAADQLLRPDLLAPGERQVEAFPVDPVSGQTRRRNRLNRLVVLRLDPTEMTAETRARSAAGVLAYSALCTHRGCTIKSWMAQKRRLRCHCHLSEFDPLAAGHVERGPARRNLPMVPVDLNDDGLIVITAGFTSKPGGAKK